MIITISHLFKKKATVRLPGREIGLHRSGIPGSPCIETGRSKGRENCTACGLCAVACPAEAITMEAAERKKGEEHLYREEKYAAVYEINMLRCIFCGICEEACPKDAIYLTDRILPSNYATKQIYLRKGFIGGRNRIQKKELI